MLLTGAVMGLALNQLDARAQQRGGTQPIAARAGEIVGYARIIDGDTVEIDGHRIRFPGIDAPERRQACGGAPVGQMATAALERITAGKRLVCAPRGADDYGRTLADCRADGESVSARLVREGWAMDYPRFSGGRFALAQFQAQTAGRGLWAHQCLAPWTWRRLNSL
ncbi:MAG: thermonuclease family protein [Hyphomonadaceae bacterium]